MSVQKQPCVVSRIGDFASDVVTINEACRDYVAAIAAGTAVRQPDALRNVRDRPWRRGYRARTSPRTCSAGRDRALEAGPDIGTAACSDRGLPDWPPPQRLRN